MTDYQQAAIEALKDEVYNQLSGHYGDFCALNTDEALAIIAAAEPHLRRKWAVEAETLMPEMGSHINVTPYREGVADGINRVLHLLEGAGE